jgi:hypothetical protein
MPRRKAVPEPSAPASATRGLDALDRDRAASLAYEGGAAGAQVEAPRATHEAEGAMRQAMPIPRPERPVPPAGDMPERPQERRLPGKYEITPFDDSDETPAIPTRLRQAERDSGAK